MRVPRLVPELTAAKAVAVVAALALLVAACGGGGADPQPAGEATRLERAQQEGRLVWYSGIESSVAEKIAAGFTEKTGIAVDSVRLGGEEILTRVLQESEVGVNLADVVWTGNEAHFVAFKQAGVLEQFTAQDDQLYADFKDPEGFYYIPYVLRFGIAYNTDVVPPAEVPRTWEDVADPRWTGRTVTSHPGYSVGAAIVPYYWSTLYGYEFLDRIAATQPKIFQSLHDVIGLVESGEAPVALLMADFIAVNAANEGSPVAMVYPSDGVPATSAALGLMRNAPNPNAAAEFMDYALSAEAQQFIADDNRTAVREDVQYGDGYVPLSEIGDQLKIVDAVAFEAELERVRQEFTARFGV
jgi:iron(III) transport system substrate-binding protein